MPHIHRKIGQKAGRASGAVCRHGAPVHTHPLPENRRGVLLLVALVMLALFMMLGTSYILIANRRRPCTAVAGASSGSTPETAAEKTVEQTTDTTLFGQPDGSGSGATVGTTVKSRVAKFFTNSLLADKYGDWYEEGQLQSIRPVTTTASNGNSLRFYTITTSGSFSYKPDTTIAAYGSTPDLGSHVGRIMSIDSEVEPAASFRIVAKQGSTYLVHLLNSAAEFDYTKLKAKATLTIQGREFSGRRDESFHLHESWDAPDGRNLFMAWVPAEATLGRNQQPGTDDPTAAVAHRYVIPSFHRPDKLLALVKDDPTAIISTGSTSWFSPAAIAMLRPMGKMSWDPTINWSATYGINAPELPQATALEHPNFTGGNVRTVNGQQVFFDPLHGPWDVDNDGDGITDSIWMDVGMSPVKIEGAEYQPLVAMMILDLDGRINLNAHGTDFNVANTGTVAAPADAGRRYAGTVSGTTTGTAGPNAASLPKAQGWGVADIDPRIVFGLQNINALSAGVALAEGRYGDSRNGDGALSPAPGMLGQSDCGVGELAVDSAAKPRDHYLPDSYAGGSGSADDRARACAVMSPVDPRGAMAVGLDQFGQPYFSKRSPTTTPTRMAGVADSRWVGDRVDDPYDISLGRGAPRPGWAYDPDVVPSAPSTLQDNLFTGSQFARVLRAGESAASRYSSRLTDLMGTGVQSIARVSTTVESWDSTAATVPWDVLENLLTLSDQFDASKPSLISWDLAMGLRMDVNRPFGDGLDNNSNGLADEPGEYQDESSANAYGMAGNPFANQCVTNGRDVDGDGDCDAQDQDRARELFARHLYVLARKMVQNLPAREAAQWAVNVVDMRDPDSIITRFPYDANFGPTSTTWDASDPANVVWGCERPELLITEAMAWRNIRSGTNAASGQPEYSDKGTGGLVIELYHPWIGATDGGNRSSRLPREYQDPSAGNFTTGQMDLACVNPSGQPIFQILTLKETSAVSGTLASDPTWPRSLSGTSGTNGIAVYLAKSSTLAMTGSNGTFVSRDGPNTENTTIRPGQFAIISGPVSGTGGLLANQIDTLSGTGAMNFLLDDFSDSTRAQVLELSTGLTETITGSNGSSPDDRSTVIDFPTVGIDEGPVGAMIAVQPTTSSTVLRFPAVTGTTANLSYMAQEKYRILLRRLANPIQPYNATLNPYICIDSLVVQDQAVVASGAATGLQLKSAERCAAQPADGSENNIWRHGSEDDTSNNAAISPTLIGSVTGITASLGFMPARLKVSGGLDTPASVEQPAFPWLTWLNREFVSPHELLLVPKSSPATLLQEHSHAWPFDHLFFQLGSGTNAAQTDLQSQKAGLLEFLRVPSRFADSETRVPTADAIAISQTLVSGQGRPLYLPPHNYMSQFREPGRVNLNTMSSRTVWAALNNGRPGAPYEDEVEYNDTGTALIFVPSEDWPNAAGASKPSAGNWQLDAGEDAGTQGNGQLDLNHDENNDGLQQISKTNALKSIVASRRGWPISTSGATPSIAGQFDRVLNRQGLSATQLWFSSPFQSGWTSGTTPTYAPAQSLLIRNWAGTSANFMRMPQGSGYRRLKRTNGVTLTAGSTYVCTIRFRGNVSFNAPGNDKLPEMLLNGSPSNPTLDPNPASISRLVLQDTTTYTSAITPSATGSYNLQIAIIPQADVDILGINLIDLTTSTELLTNGDFSDGTTGWQSVNPGDATLQTDNTATQNGPVFLIATNLGLKDSQSKARTGRPYADPERNPFFRYREMMRLSNLTTSRSNVFAVWTTVGLFAIEDHPTRSGDKALGAEYGLESGKNVRFKSFSIIDRSIPVGYRPGVPLNSVDAVLLDQFGN